MDAILGGINDWILGGILSQEQTANVEAITPFKVDNNLCKFVVFLPMSMDIADLLQKISTIPGTQRGSVPFDVPKQSFGTSNGTDSLCLPFIVLQDVRPLGIMHSVASLQKELEHFSVVKKVILKWEAKALLNVFKRGNLKW